MSDFNAIGAVATGGELLVRHAREYASDANTEFTAVIAAGAELIELGLQQLATPDEPIAGTDAWLEQVAALDAQLGAAEQATPMSEFLTAQADPVCQLAELFEQWQDDPSIEAGQYTELANGWLSLQSAATEFSITATAQLAGAGECGAGAIGYH